VPAGEPFAREVCVPLAFWMRVATEVDASHIRAKRRPANHLPGNDLTAGAVPRSRPPAVATLVA
jgi:hypothetical protein